jgi:hypothetical protein
MNRTQQFSKMRGLLGLPKPKPDPMEPTASNPFPSLSKAGSLTGELTESLLPHNGKNYKALVNKTHPLTTKQQRFLALRRKMGGG